MANIEITIEPESDLTIFTVEGDLTTNEILHYSSESYNKNPTKLVLWDASNGSVSKIAPTDFRGISKEMKQYTKKREGGKTAFVGKFDLDFSLGRLYEVYAEIENLPVTYQTFRSNEEAMRWLKS